MRWWCILKWSSLQTFQQLLRLPVLPLKQLACSNRSVLFLKQEIFHLSMLQVYSVQWNCFLSIKNSKIPELSLNKVTCKHSLVLYQNFVSAKFKFHYSRYFIIIIFLIINMLTYHQWLVSWIFLRVSTELLQLSYVLSHHHCSPRVAVMLHCCTNRQWNKMRTTTKRSRLSSSYLAFKSGLIALHTDDTVFELIKCYDDCWNKSFH